MAEIKGWEQPPDEIESLVRAAGKYVRPSDDLRPRVLETARSERHDRWAQQRLWQVALVVALLAVLSNSVHSERELAASHPGHGFAAQSTASSAPAGIHPSEAAFHMVDSFTDMRRRQAELLRLAQ